MEGEEEIAMRVGGGNWVFLWGGRKDKRWVGCVVTGGGWVSKHEPSVPNGLLNHVPATISASRVRESTCAWSWHGVGELAWHGWAVWEGRSHVVALVSHVGGICAWGRGLRELRMSSCSPSQTNLDELLFSVLENNGGVLFSRPQVVTSIYFSVSKKKI